MISGMEIERFNKKMTITFVVELETPNIAHGKNIYCCQMLICKIEGTC